MNLLKDNKKTTYNLNAPRNKPHKNYIMCVENSHIKIVELVKKCKTRIFFLFISNRLLWGGPFYVNIR